MFATNAPQAASELLSLPKESGRTGRVDIARSSSEEGKVDNLKGSGDTPQHKSSPPAEQVNKAYLKQTKKAGGEKLDDALPRLAPVRIPSLGTKWEYYSGAPLPQEPRSPDGDGDSEDSAEGPRLPKDASKSSAPRARSIGSSLSTGSNFSRTSQGGIKRKRSLPGTPDPNAEVIALSPKTLLATNRFVCEICNKGFQRDQNLQLHRRGHNVPWKLRARPPSNSSGKRVYVCPEPTCVHHDPRRALGDLTGIKKHYSRKHGEKRWKCEKCGKKYAVEADWKAHTKTCGPKQYACDCGSVFTRRETFATHRACCNKGPGSVQVPGHSPLSAFASVPATHSFSNFQLPPSSYNNFVNRPILPRRLPPPAPIFTGRSPPSTVTHIGQSHDGTPLLISFPARVSGAGQPGMMADVNLAARRGLDREPLQLLPLSGGPMWGQRGLGTPPLAAPSPMQPGLNLWLGSNSQPTAVHPSQPLQPLAIPNRMGAVKMELGNGGNGVGEVGQGLEGGMSPLSLGASLRLAEAFAQASQGQQGNARAASPLLQPLPVSPRPQAGSEQQAGDSGAAMPSAAAAAAAVAAANAGHQVTIEVNPAPGETLPAEHVPPQEPPVPAEGGPYGMLEQPPAALPMNTTMGTSPEAPIQTLMSAAALGGGEVTGIMEQQGQGGGLLISTAQVGAGDQTTLLDAQQPGGEGAPVLVGGGQVVGGNQEGVLWAQMPVDEQQKAQQAQAQAQQAQAQAQAQQSMQQQMAAQQAQQQGLQMAIHQAGIQLAAVQQAQQQGLQIGGPADLQQTLHIGVDAPPHQAAIPPGVQVGLTPMQQGLPQQMVAAQQEMLAHAQGAEQQLAAQQGLLNLQATSQQMGLSAAPPLQQLSPGLPSMTALHPSPMVGGGAEMHAALQQSATSPRSLLAALPSGSANTTAQGAAATGLEEETKADMMQEAISAAARGSTQKLKELIEQEAQKQALAQATEQHQHDAKLAQMGGETVLTPAGVVLVEGSGQEGRAAGFVDPQTFEATRGGQFLATMAPQTGLVALGSGPAGGIGGQVVGSSLLGGAISAAQLSHSELSGASLSPREGEQLLRSLSRQHMSELAAAGMAPALNVGGPVTGVGGQMALLPSVDEGSRHVERGRQEAIADEQLHSQQSIASIVGRQHLQADIQQHPHMLGEVYREPGSLIQSSMGGNSLGHVNDHPSS